MRLLFVLYTILHFEKKRKKNRKGGPAAWLLCPPPVRHRDDFSAFGRWARSSWLEKNADSTLLRGIALRAGRNLQEKLFSLPADAPCAEAVDTADGSWKRTVSSKGAGGVTALCPVESRLYLGLAGSEKVRSANL